MGDPAGPVARATAPLGRLRAALAAPKTVLFASMFAAQAALLVLSPILPQLAADLDVSTATAAQLRAVSGVTAGVVAVWLGLRSRPRPLRRVLAAGLTLLAGATAVSAAAPTFAVLALAQAAIGVALALVLSASLAAAGQWSRGSAAPTLSWALIGQPAAWIVGMPVAGAVAEIGWRWAWVAVPLVASLAALGALALRPRDAVPPPAPDEPPMWRQPGMTGWALGELAAYGAWAGTLVFAGALFVESYRVSSTAVGLILAAAAAAYLPGNFLARRWADRPGRALLVAPALASAGGVALFGGVRPGVAWSLAVLAVLAFLAGGRTIAGSSLGLRLARECRLQAMSARTAAVQLGYLLGATLGGAALAAGGYPWLGVTLAALWLVAVVAHLPWIVGARRRGLAAPAAPAVAPAMGPIELDPPPAQRP